MGSALEIGIKIRKVLVISTRACYRSVCNHPFLVGFLGFLFLLYRSFPFLFSLLVSASPVLVCTAVLLGTLLSFGQPNIPEVEKEEKVTHGISSLQIGISEGATVVADRNESHFVKGYSEIRSDIEERGIEEEASLVGDKDNKKVENEEDGGLLSDVPLDDDNSENIHPKKQVNEEVEREFETIELGKKREVHEENLRSEGVSSDEEAIEKQYVLVQKENDDIVDTDNEKSPADSLDNFKGDHVDFVPSSSWKRVENNHEEEEEESVESGSDEAESSSPDASMADIIPMLDELHPLLDLEAPPPALLSGDGSDAASEKSQKSDDDSVESDEDAENHGEADEDGADEHDDEEEEEIEGGKEDESKSAIKWTEDDQKNLMDLGTIELERNQRLENLIARRRARRLMTEKNLIDLDSVDLPCNVAPIATTRCNPFDFLDDSYAFMGLPPIPGSAPSVLQPRRNPFDLPYDSNEEKPDLKGDSFQQEFSMFNQKDAFFRRHESFSLGPSVLGMSKHDRHDFSWKPIFISERMASEGTSYPSFQRQSSEVSDAKLSSVPDTESVSSIDQDERKLSEQDLSQETELVANIDHVSDHFEHGSHSSGDIASVEIIQAEESNVRHDEVEIVLGGVESPYEMEPYPEREEGEIREQFNAGETHLRTEPIDEESSSRSSQSSLSEVIDNIPDEKMENSTNMQQGDDHIQEARIPTQASVEGSNFQDVSSEVEDNQHIEPVYDSSPPAAGKLRSFSSVSSDSATEFSERTVPLVSVEMAANVADKESEVHDQRLEDNTSDHEEAQAASSQLPMEIKDELRTENSKDTNPPNVTAVEISAVAPNFVDQNGSAESEFLVVPDSVDSGLPSDTGIVKVVANSGFACEQDLANHLSADSEILLQDNEESPASNYQMASENLHSSDNESVEEGAAHHEVSRFDIVNMSEAVQDANEMLDLVTSDVHHIASDDSLAPTVQNLQPSLVAGRAPVVHPSLPAEETEHIEKKLPNKEDIFQVEQDKVFSSSSVELGNIAIHQDLDKNLVSSSSNSQYEIYVKSTSNLENNLSGSEKLAVAPSSSDHNEIQVESAQGVSTSNDGVGEFHDAMDKIPQSISSATTDTTNTPEFRSPTGEVDFEFGRHGAVENEGQNDALKPLDPSAEGSMSLITEENIKELDEMKEIDEGFLSELDTVGDFSVSDAGISLHADLLHKKTSDAQVSSLPKDVKEAVVDQDIPVLEARSPEDINLAFKQLQEGVDVKEVILPSTIKDQLVSEESKEHLEIDSDFEVVEARSLDDIKVSFEKILEGNQGELPKPLDLKDGSVNAEANEVGSAKVIEFSNVANGAEEISGTKLENVPKSSSSNEARSHRRRSSSSSSSSSNSSDYD